MCVLTIGYCLVHRSAKKHNRSTRKRHQSSRFARIKRHFSQANMDDFASSSRTSALEKSSSFAVSEYNILEKVITQYILVYCQYILYNYCHVYCHS